MQDVTEAYQNAGDLVAPGLTLRGDYLAKVLPRKNGGTGLTSGDLSAIPVHPEAGINAAAIYRIEGVGLVPVAMGNVHRFRHLFKF